MNRTDKKGFRQSAWYPVLYMFVLTFFFSAVLIGFARYTADRVEGNKQIMFERAVLMAVGAETNLNADPKLVHEIFERTIEQPDNASGGAYIYVKGDQPEAYALPFEGKGFWNLVKGVIGLSADGRTMTGMAIYEQSETPGLGAEITKPYFTDQFREQLLAEGDTPVSLKPAGTAGADDVEAVTGATQTCTRLEDILNSAIAEWRKNTQHPTSNIERSTEE